MLSLILAGALAATPTGNKVKLAVLDLTDKGVGSGVAQNLTDVVTVALTQLGVIDVLSRADIQQMVQFEQQKQMVGCDSDTSCLAELGGALGVALLVTGSIGKIGKSYIINLVLTDTSSVKVLAREQRQVDKDDQLTSEATGAARFLVRALLAGQEGDLIVRTPENGADVEIDGRIVGVTPLARQTLAGGPHTLRVVKTGFVTWAKDVEVKKEQPVVIDVALVPSLEFIKAYDDRASTWRVFAYIAGGAGVALTAFGSYGYFVYNANRAKQFNDDATRAGCNAGSAIAPTTNCLTAFQGRHEDTGRFDVISSIGGWTGVVALAVSAYLFTQGPSPGLYDQYKPQSSVGVAIAPNRVLGAWTLQF